MSRSVGTENIIKHYLYLWRCDIRVNKPSINTQNRLLFSISKGSNSNEQLYSVLMWGTWGKRMLWWSFPGQMNRELLSLARLYKAAKWIIIRELERGSLFNKLNLNPVTLAGWKKWKKVERIVRWTYKDSRVLNITVKFLESSSYHK